MPDEIHHPFDEERPWGADLIGGIGRGMAPIYRSILFRVPHHWKDRRIIRAGGSREPSRAKFELKFESQTPLAGKKKLSTPTVLYWVAMKKILENCNIQANFIENLSSLCHLREVTARGGMEDGGGWRACPGPAVGYVFKELMLLSRAVYLSLIWLWSFHSPHGRLMLNNQRWWCPDKAQGHRD